MLINKKNNQWYYIYTFKKCIWKRHADKIFDILNLFIAFLNINYRYRNISNVPHVNTIFKQYHFCVSNLFRLIVNRNILLSNDRSEIKHTGAIYHTHFIAKNLHLFYNADITKRWCKKRVITVNNSEANLITNIWKLIYFITAFYVFI